MRAIGASAPLSGRALRILRGYFTGVKSGRWSVPIVAAFAAMVLHALGNPHYGFFRDELYFIICGRHPALGYVDQPPLTPLLAALSQSFGRSLFLLRLIPAICAGLATLVSCLVAEELGGGTFAQILTAIVVTLAPVLTANETRLTPDMLEIPLWPLAALYITRIVKGASSKLWLLVGAIIALAAWSKYSVAFFVFAVIVGLAFSRYRKVLLTRWFLAGCALCGAMILPDFVWQATHNFPMLQVLHNDNGQFIVLGPPFLLQQILIMNPVLSIVWIAGLFFLFRAQETRWMATAYVVLVVTMAALDAKNYYPAAVYPYLIAAGAVAIESATRLRAARVAIAAGALAVSIPAVPFVIPVLPLHNYVAYQNAVGRVLHVDFGLPDDRRKTVPIQFYADMLGWPQLVSAVAAVYGNLPPRQRAHTAILASNFGEASAIDVYGKAFGLPQAISANNNFWLWGPRQYTGRTVIEVNLTPSEARRYFAHVRVAAVFHNGHVMPYEDDVPILVCSGIREPLAQLWPHLRVYGYALRTPSDDWRVGPQ
jgi:4-amino-4-deoxy-L-arabinose transferase-like glycosyltransferase